MKQMLNPIATGAITVGVSDLTPTVEWGLQGFRGPPPENLAGLIAGVIVLISHALYNYLAARFAQPANPSQPSGPASSPQ